MPAHSSSRSPVPRSAIPPSGPAEYSTNILAAAIAEDWKGPVFIQGDHFQMSAKKYASDAQAEINAVKDLAREAISAGFFNIDIDTSTLVDVSKPSVPEQQETNFSLSSEFAAFIRDLEPKGVTISIGGEIGEVGGHNSTEEELRGFMDGFNAGMKKTRARKTGLEQDQHPDRHVPWRHGPAGWHAGKG